MGIVRNQERLQEVNMRGTESNTDFSETSWSQFGVVVVIVVDFDTIELTLKTIICIYQIGSYLLC